MVLSIKSRLLISHLTIALVAALAASLYLFVSFKKLLLGYHEHALLASAYSLADALDTHLNTPHGLGEVERSMQRFPESNVEKFAVLDINGRVLSSSVPWVKRGSSFVEGVLDASNGGEYLSIKDASGPNDERIIAVIPIEINQNVLGIVRAWILEKDYQASVGPVKRVISIAMSGVAVLCVLLSLLLAQALITPIKQMRQLSGRIAKGDFTIRLKSAGGDELGRLAQDLNSMASRLQDLESTRRDFMGNVSHELRSPVSNIRITSEVLERRAKKLGDDSAKLFQTVVHETERLEMLINELMELSAIDSGALTLQMEVFNLRELLQELVDNVSPRVQQKNLTVGLFADPVLEITADRQRLERAVSNLLDNAIKFTPSGGQIVLSGRQEDSETIIEVTDNGDGIAHEDLARIFERFYRTDKARGRKGGSGIGLSIVRHIAEAHGGKAEANSREGHGSTFRIRLPNP